MSFARDYRHACEYEARARIQEALVCEDEAARQSALDELMHLDRALHAGRILSHDWTGPLGAPLPPPTFALPAPRIPRKAPRLCDAAREALSAARAWVAPRALGITANVLAWPLCGLALAIAWGITLGRPIPAEPPFCCPHSPSCPISSSAFCPSAA